MVSAHPIIAIDLFDHKLELALKMGATHTINSKKTFPENEILNIVGGNGADIVIDNTGDVDIIRSAYQVTSQSGKTILVGVPPKGNEVKLYTLPLHFKKILTGSHGGEAKPDMDIPRYIRLIESGKMNLDGLITHEFSLEKINNALDLFRSGEAGRIIISFTK